MTTTARDQKACRYIIDSIYEHCRIKLHEGKEALIKARLGKLMRLRGITSLPDYVHFLRSKADEDEFTRVVDALTTNFTNFMRESDQFDFLVHEALPKVLKVGVKRLHVWSAACSSGEEPYSIAMYLADYYPQTEGWDWRVTASDISTKVLALAERGVYAQEKVVSIPGEWIRKYFQRGTGRWSGHVRVKPELTQRVHVRQINLIESYEHPQNFEAVFCRNVMIYFDRATQEQLVRQLCRHIVPGGYLFIGHSESLNGLKLPVRCLKPSIYQRF